jgi:16S rRNA A1518/A1519 N6-dimethyltransferase RsmA/KsgA/DIM1 with predicted DNA glycosylase/AP lyase activity
MMQSLAMANDHFGDAVAARYDEDCASMFDPDVLGPTVDVLVDLAGDGRALEFAVGTGRVALPIAARGVPVASIELSTAMAERLRAKDRARSVELTVGNIATTRVIGAFGSSIWCSTRSGT